MFNRGPKAGSLFVEFQPVTLKLLVPRALFNTLNKSPSASVARLATSLFLICLFCKGKRVAKAAVAPFARIGDVKSKGDDVKIGDD